VGRGGDHLKLRLADAGAELDAIGWGMGRRAPGLAGGAGTTVDVAYRLERDEYQGESRLQAKLADVRR
jgi:RecJ OB domain